MQVDVTRRLKVPAHHWATRFALGAVFLAMISQLTFADPDMFHALSLIREAVLTGELPRVDPFAYTPTVVPFVHHEWGAGAILYVILVWGQLGSAGIITLKYALTSGVVIGCFVCARRTGATESVMTVLAPIAMLLGWVGFTTIRAQLYTLVFLTALMLMMQSDRQGKRRWVAVWLVLYVVWLNIHGGFLAGCGLLLIYTLEQTVKTAVQTRSVWASWRQHWHLPLTLGAMCVLANVNPYGPELLRELVSAVQLERPLIPEWGPLWTSPHAPVLIVAYVLSLAALLPALRAKHWWQLDGLPLVLVTAWLALQHVRHGSIYAIVWFCLVPGYLSHTSFEVEWGQIWERNRRWVGLTGLVIGSLFCSIAVKNEFWKMKLPVEKPIGALLYPEGAVNYLRKAGFRGNLMTPFTTGAFVSWKLYPMVKVSFDGRYEAAYPPTAIQENADFFNAGSGWREALTRYPTDLVLVPRRAPVAERMEKDSEWTCIYEDKGYRLYAQPGLEDGLPTVPKSQRLLPVSFP